MNHVAQIRDILAQRLPPKDELQALRDYFKENSSAIPPDEMEAIQTYLSSHNTEYTPQRLMGYAGHHNYTELQARGSGRTYRMVRAAVRQAMKGEGDVVLIGHNQVSCDNIRAMVKELVPFGISLEQGGEAYTVEGPIRLMDRISSGLAREQVQAQTRLYWTQEGQLPNPSYPFMIHSNGSRAIDEANTVEADWESLRQRMRDRGSLYTLADDYQPDHWDEVYDREKEEEYREHAQRRIEKWAKEREELQNAFGGGRVPPTVPVCYDLHSS